MIAFATGGMSTDAPYDGTYKDPGCPDAGAKPTEFMCDAYSQDNCPSGEGCYIFVIYPEDPCDQETYGSTCAPAGSGTQGAMCGSGAPSCAPGFTCLVTGEGNQCAQLCMLDGPNTCTDGTVCQTIDVEGFGGCL
jgi:hypothetical protein